MEDALAITHGLAVTGFMFEIDVSAQGCVKFLHDGFMLFFQSTDNAAMTPLVDALKNIEEKKAKFPFSSSGFLVSELIEGVAPISGATTPYSTYTGSLTTPGCFEAVHWINFLTPLKISSAQLAEFR